MSALLEIEMSQNVSEGMVIFFFFFSKKEMVKQQRFIEMLKFGQAENESLVHHLQGGSGDRRR